jgi:hypothetical protein
MNPPAHGGRVCGEFFASHGVLAKMMLRGPTSAAAHRGLRYWGGWVIRLVSAVGMSASSTVLRPMPGGGYHTQPTDHSESFAP